MLRILGTIKLSKVGHLCHGIRGFIVILIDIYVLKHGHRFSDQ